MVTIMRGINMYLKLMGDIMKTKIKEYGAMYRLNQVQLAEKVVIRQETIVFL